MLMGKPDPASLLAFKLKRNLLADDWRSCVLSNLDFSILSLLLGRISRQRQNPCFRLFHATIGFFGVGLPAQ